MKQYTDWYICIMINEISKSERTKAFIIERTAEVFNKKGYAGTSMADLTSVTGLSKGSIYGNFENKEAVALAVFDHSYQRLRGLADQEIQKCTSFHQKLMAYPNLYRKITSGGITRGGCPIMNTAVESDDTNKPLKRKAADAVQHWCDQLESLILQGITAGEFREDAQARRTAVSIVSLIEGGVMLTKVTNNAANMDCVLQTVDELIKKMEA